MEVRGEVVVVVEEELTLRGHHLLSATSAVRENEKAISDQMEGSRCD